jgi:uncharacterized protein (DUF1800 family)
MSANLRSVIAANRFGLGARPREITDIGSAPCEWLLEQVSLRISPEASRTVACGGTAFLYLNNQASIGPNPALSTARGATTPINRLRAVFKGFLADLALYG